MTDAQRTDIIMETPRGFWTSKTEGVIRVIMVVKPSRHPKIEVYTND